MKRPLVLLAAVLTLGTGSDAQEPPLTGWHPPPPPPPQCVNITCPAGPRGPAGPPGPPGSPTPGPTPTIGPRSVPPFDLWVRGINFNARAIVKDGAKTYVLVYAAQYPAAALVDIETGLAQIALNFDAGVGPDPAHPGQLILFDDVDVLTPRSFLWWHKGASWAHTWDSSLPWQPMLGFRWR